MIAILSPGQGAQKPEMFKPWLNDERTSQKATLLLTSWSEYTGVDLIHLGTEASEEEILDTQNTQPLLVAAAILGFEFLADLHKLPDKTIIAGHSVGELAVAGISGIISTKDAVKLASIRGKAMAEACSNSMEPTGMVALLGGEKTEVLYILEKNNLLPANFNAKGQIVAAGKISDIDKLAGDPPERIRVRKLAVAGAFHSKYMESAQLIFENSLKELKFNDPKYVVLTNQNGKIVENGAEMMHKIAQQITNTVDWTACINTMLQHQVDTTVELPPAGVLTNIAKREIKEANKLSFSTPEELYTLNF